ncbi:MAG TPA: tetratricopeptide repeat protein [Puia sp.]|uniref:tetratricopeptide repeat protein n=1 Tax=Puia sp. TaxID=2045100 RepID=UPI002CE872A3|nr:tetratricopeptide repeat protein [Puia sp.]HVU95886.1 tetratricopeptide repeat protein [Puia sp.]
MTKTLVLTLTVALAGCCITACNNHEDKKNDATATLHRLPYKPLTDSLDQAKGDAAGLYYRRAELLAHNNLHELAAIDFRHSWELRPDETTGFRYAATLGIIGQADRAMQLLKDCERRFPDNPAFPSMLGELYQQSGKIREAIAVYDSILAKDSGDFEAWYEKGLLLEKAKDTAGAITALGNAWRLQPTNTYGLELAHMYAENRNPAALPICDEILKKDSAHELLDPLFIKGIFYSNTTQYKKAIVQFDSCIRRDWKFTDAYLEKGIALYEQKQYDSAMSTFLMTVRVSNTYPDGYYWVGRCYEATGRNDQAILYYHQALALDKDFTEAADRIKKLQ